MSIRTTNSEGTELFKVIKELTMDLAPYKELLLKMRQESNVDETDFTTTMKAEQAADEIDVASNDSNAALAKRLLERQQSYVKRIDIALAKIDDGTYGECEGCGEMISAKRLLARPIAVMCILCKEKQEQKEKVEKLPRGFMSDSV
jgi:DnaK suppressor protein